MSANKDLEQLFVDTFASPPEVCGQANGRVNLIGEHIDYNGGMVIPMQISPAVHVAIGRNSKSQDTLYSQTFGDSVSRAIGAQATHHWSDYVFGALAIARQQQLLDAGVNGGVNVVVTSNLHYGAGVSSSAAIIIACLRALCDLKGQECDAVTIARLAQQVEHQYIGMPCGIMDQMAVAAAKQNYALALNTKTLEFSHVPLPTDYQFVVLFSGVTRRLDEGRYAVRREECEQAAQLLHVEDLCLISPKQAQSINSLKRPFSTRARHVYTEHQRVLQTIAALKQDDVQQVGDLMVQSHVSMRDDFEITTTEVDAVVDTAIREGAVGARMTGGGFGGCIVALVASSDVDDWATNVIAQHPKAEFIC